MHKRDLVLGVSGSIAAYKAVDLASKLTQAGVNVHVVMTEAATKLVGEASFRAITGFPVSTSMFELTNPHSIEHISLADLADAFLLAPCTANVMAKVTHGIADDLLTCTALATRAPIMIAPAMHTAMWENAATQANLETLKSRGVRFVGPAVGRLASGGYGAGRFSPVPEIFGEVMALLGKGGDLTGCKLVITAAGTRETIDPVRFIGNRSTGKMGYALAEAARDRGAEVTLVSGPSQLETPSGMNVIHITSAQEMLNAVTSAASEADVLIMAAAVADYAPASSATQKLKKSDHGMDLHLTRTTDILDTVRRVPVRVGFAAETDQLIENAKSKLDRKGLDLIVANDVRTSESGFAADDNRCVLIDAQGNLDELPLLPKREVSDRILDRIVQLLDRTATSK